MRFRAVRHRVVLGRNLPERFGGAIAHQDLWRVAGAAERCRAEDLFDPADDLIDHVLGHRADIEPAHLAG